MQGCFLEMYLFLSNSVITLEYPYQLDENNILFAFVFLWSVVRLNISQCKDWLLACSVFTLLGLVLSWLCGSAWHRAGWWCHLIALWGPSLCVKLPLYVLNHDPLVPFGQLGAEWQPVTPVCWAYGTGTLGKRDGNFRPKVGLKNMC